MIRIFFGRMEMSSVGLGDREDKKTCHSLVSILFSTMNIQLGIKCLSSSKT